jgi:hypothetical protein
MVLCHCTAWHYNLAMLNQALPLADEPIPLVPQLN